MEERGDKAKECGDDLPKQETDRAIEAVAGGGGEKLPRRPRLHPSKVACGVIVPKTKGKGTTVEGHRQQSHEDKGAVFEPLLSHRLNLR